LFAGGEPAVRRRPDEPLAGKSADYIVTGPGEEGLSEAKTVGTVRSAWAATQRPSLPRARPVGASLDPNAAYVHLTSTTIGGNQFRVSRHRKGSAEHVDIL
jgi:hypothetical protein